MTQNLAAALANALTNLVPDEATATAANTVIEAITLGTSTTPGFDLHARADLGEFKAGDVVTGTDLNAQFQQLAAAFGEGDADDTADEASAE